MSGAGRLLVEGAGLAAAVVLLGVWASAQQRAASAQTAYAVAPTPAVALVQGAISPSGAASTAGLMERAEAALMRNDEAQAMQLFQAVLALEPHHVEAGLREVELLMSAGQDEAALRALMPRQVLLVPGGEEHARALCLEAGGRMALEPARAAQLAQRACEAGAEACCDPFELEH